MNYKPNTFSAQFPRKWRSARTPVTSIYRLESHAREKFLCDGYAVLVDVLALCALHEERLSIPRTFTRLIWKAANVRNRRADDIERNLKLERLNGGVEVGQEERARN
jgi:hypothetical protein